MPTGVFAEINIDKGTQQAREQDREGKERDARLVRAAVRNMPGRPRRVTERVTGLVERW